MNKRKPISPTPSDSTAAISFERLVALFFAHQGNVVDKWEQYLSIYASEFGRFLSQAQPVRLLEIGVQNGGSLDLWAKYLPTDSEIVGWISIRQFREFTLIDQSKWLSLMSRILNDGTCYSGMNPSTSS